MPTCSIVGCGSYYARNKPEITLHKLPAAVKIRNAWLESIRVENLKSHKTIYVCSLHFEDSCFNRTLNYVKLHDNVLPSRRLTRCAGIINTQKVLSERNAGPCMALSQADAHSMILIMFLGTSKERYFHHNTLLCLVKGLTGQNITVDLRNDAYVCGNLDTVDGYMNISMTKLVYCDPQGNEFFFDNMFIQSRNIRYVHIPETASILSIMKKELGGNKKPIPNKKGINQSRKVKKALKQHLDTVASLELNK